MRKWILLAIVSAALAAGCAQPEEPAEPAAAPPAAAAPAADGSMPKPVKSDQELSLNPNAKIVEPGTKL